jgi:hypothetical protein
MEPKLPLERVSSSFSGGFPLLLESFPTTAVDTQALFTPPEPSLWRAVKHLWCKHQNTFRTQKTDTMPAHVVCRSCGWREPVIANQPVGTRTWDSSRDEARYERDKKRREAIATQKQSVEAQLAAPSSRDTRPRPGRVTNVLELTRTGSNG